MIEFENGLKLNLPNDQDNLTEFIRLVDNKNCMICSYWGVTGCQEVECFTVSKLKMNNWDKKMIAHSILHKLLNNDEFALFDIAWDNQFCPQLDDELSKKCIIILEKYGLTAEDAS